MSNKKSRRVSAAKLHKLLSELTDEICSAQERVTLAISGNTFEIHLEDAIINIYLSASQEGGEK